MKALKISTFLSLAVATACGGPVNTAESTLNGGSNPEIAVTEDALRSVKIRACSYELTAYADYYAFSRRRMMRTPDKTLGQISMRMRASGTGWFSSTAQRQARTRAKDASRNLARACARNFDLYQPEFQSCTDPARDMGSPEAGLPISRNASYAGGRLTLDRENIETLQEDLRRACRRMPPAHGRSQTFTVKTSLVLISNGTECVQTSRFVDESVSRQRRDYTCDRGVLRQGDTYGEHFFGDVL